MYQDHQLESAGAAGPAEHTDPVHPQEPKSYVAASLPEINARRAATELRNLLRINAAFSASTGAVGVGLAGPVADLLGLDQVWLVRLVAAALLGFAVSVFVVAGVRGSVLRTWSGLVSVNDLGWVTATIVVIGFGLLSTTGAVVMAVVGLIVLALGVAQIRAGSRFAGAAAKTDAGFDESPPIEVIEFTQHSPQTVEALWPVITDHELYAKLALNLKGAQGLTPNGLGFTRACTDGRGRTWSETCTLWDPGRRFDVNVDIDDYPYPLQLVQGSWRVDPNKTDGSTIGMRFAMQPDPGIRGRLFVPMMHLLFGPILKRIGRGWTKAAAHGAG